MDAFEILVVILSVTLAICLALAIVCLVFAVFILRSFRHIMAKAEVVADNVEEASEFFKNTTMTSAAVKFFSNIVHMFGRKDGKNG